MRLGDDISSDQRGALLNWFHELFGFSESADSVRDNIVVDGTQLRSLANDRVFHHGGLETPSLAELRARAQGSRLPGTIRVREVVADVRSLHREPENAGALFQVASQFNLLEMISPNAEPADGITRYILDGTQGPACAMSCAAGTLYRNWFAQTTSEQIDCLADVGTEINADDQLWTMRNGYALLTGQSFDAPETFEKLRVGLQSDTEVTDANPAHRVTQVYCSALPISYSRVRTRSVEGFSRAVLNSAYEATLAAALVNTRSSLGTPRVYLTLLGGGAFGNPLSWIVDAIERALKLYSDAALEVAIVSYGAPEPAIQRLLR